MTPQPTAATVTTEQAPGLLDRIVEQQAQIASRYKPVMSAKEFADREDQITFLVEQIMREGIDYGWVPGTKPKEAAKPGEYEAKPMLFKAGAERTCAYFGYVPRFEELVVIEEWKPDKYGEMLFYYKFRCILLKDGAPVGEGIGSGTTWESKYRYRNSERRCPDCGQPCIKKSKYPGKNGEAPGYYCYDRIGGCGAKYEADDPEITEQVLGKVPNPDIADVVNTVQKMAQKRAYVAAVLTATGLSGRFSQDMEDFEQPAPKPEPAAEPTTPRPQQAPQQQKPAPVPQAAQPKPEPPAIPTDVPPAVQDLWRRMGTKLNTACDVFAELRKDLAELSGDDAAYYHILGKHQMAHANDIKKVGLTVGRQCARDLLGAIQNLQAPPPVDEAVPFLASDDDIPTNMGGTFEPGSNPAQQKLEEAKSR